MDARSVEPCRGQSGAGGHQLADRWPGVEGSVPAADAGGVDENSARRDGPGLNVFANA